MRVTFILKDLPEEFYSGTCTTEVGGSPGAVGLLNMPTERQWTYLQQLANHKFCKRKIGINGDLKDAVALTELLRNPNSKTFKLEKRRGYTGLLLLKSKIGE